VERAHTDGSDAQWERRDDRLAKGGGGKADADTSQRSGCDTICDYYSLCGVSLVLTRNSVRETFLRTHRIDKLQDSSCAFHTRASAVLNCKSYVAPRRETKGEDRGMRDSVRRSEERRTTEN